MKRQISIPLHDVTRIVAEHVLNGNFREMRRHAVNASTTLIRDNDGLVTHFEITFETVETAAD